MKNYTIKRHIQQKIEKLIKQYKCLILTGPRQIGKSTLLLEGVLPNLKKKFNYVKLDNDDIISFAKNDPIKFLEEYKTPLYIDEVQKAPRLFSYIKTVIDDSDEKGQFILTGSESFELMKGVGDHLSTRAVVLSMQSLSNSEIQNKSNFEFVANFQKFIARKTKAITSEEIYKKIIRGSLPDLIKNKNLETDTFYQTYITSFILKDMKEDWVDIRDVAKFQNFLRVLASQVGSIVSIHSIAKLSGINTRTSEIWINGLIAMGIIFYLFPFSQTALTKTTRNPKLYFYDTGLACFLTKYKDAKTLIKSQYAGHIFECYVISEINKGFINNAHNPLLYYIKKYGTDDIREREIDLIVEGDGGIIYPIEIKANMTPKIEYFRHLKIFDNLDLNIGPMTLICMVQNIYSFGKDKLVLPVHWI